jgi:histidinol-phosphatase (PHP family)
MIDYHLHGNFCGHGAGELEEYVLEALKKEFIEIGFSAHLPKVKDPDPYHAMLETDLPRYVELVESLRSRYSGKVEIKLGIEADHFPGYEADTRRLLESFPFDYVLGSVHFLGGWHFTSRAGLGRYETENPDEVFPKYFELVKNMIRSGLFDIAAHPDAIRRAGFRPAVSMAPAYRDIAGLLMEHGMSIEVNSAGIRRGAGSLYPEEAFLKICIEENVPLTLGSDAHSPCDVGRDFVEAFKALSTLGAREIATYTSRRMRLRPLSDFNGIGARD